MIVAALRTLRQQSRVVTNTSTFPLVFRLQFITTGKCSIPCQTHPTKLRGRNCKMTILDDRPVNNHLISLTSSLLPETNVVQFWSKLSKRFGWWKSKTEKSGKKEKQSCKKKKEAKKQNSACLEKPKADGKAFQAKEKKKADPCQKSEEKCNQDKIPCKNIEEKKEDPCKKEEGKKADPCKKKEEKKADPCKNVEEKQSNLCKTEEKKVDPCKKKEEKKADPCKKKVDPCKKEEKKADPCKMKEEKKADPCKKKADPCKKEEKKADPCKKKANPCNKEEKKADPCRMKDKVQDPCMVKQDPCKKEDNKDACKKKEDPCKKRDPCRLEEKKDQCKSQDPSKKEDPCKKKDSCQKNNDSCKKRNPCDACDKFVPLEPTFNPSMIFLSIPDECNKLGQEDLSDLVSWKIELRARIPYFLQTETNLQKSFSTPRNRRILENKGELLLEEDSGVAMTTCENGCTVQHNKNGRLEFSEQGTSWNMEEISAEQLECGISFASYPNGTPETPSSEFPASQVYFERLTGMFQKIEELWHGPFRSPQNFKANTKTKVNNILRGNNMVSWISHCLFPNVADAPNCSISILYNDDPGKRDDFSRCEDRKPPCPLEPPKFPCPAKHEECQSHGDGIWSDIDHSYGYEKFPFKADPEKDMRLEEVSKKSDDPFSNHKL